MVANMRSRMSLFISGLSHLSSNGGVCRDGSTSCFKCGQSGHFMRECPKKRQGSGNGGNRTQSSSVALTRVVKFQFSNEPVIEWRSSLAHPKGRFISDLKERNLVSKACIYHLVRANDSSVEAPPIQSVPVMSEFPEVFLDDLPGVPPEKSNTF
ncbi:hypothetical protein H5410_002173 [Solanum commersonii]|uniref:CCHC-type domain-containing protein n=1 Tax=Solanum commersonii TaxID=4109 RepID=A0A9J6B186_SOLCO|nr:hypothetical protein H5410_002173 [Solanum commersonii]